MIDCKGLELTSETKQTITGIFNRIKEALGTGKPCIVYNTKWDSYPMSPISVMINERPSGHYIATASTLQMEVDNEDGVEIINMLAGL